MGKKELLNLTRKKFILMILVRLYFIIVLLNIRYFCAFHFCSHRQTVDNFLSGKMSNTKTMRKFSS